MRGTRIDGGTIASSRVRRSVQRLVEQVLAVEPQDIEEERHDGQLGPERRDVELPPEAAHGDLERERSLVWLERDDFAVEDQLAAPAARARRRRLRAPRAVTSLRLRV